MSNHRYAHVDAMRAVAVLLVVLAHSGLGSVVPGGSGVTIFFTISGFIISHLVLKEVEASGRFDVRGFYARRFFKIFPPLVVVLIVPAIVLEASGVWNISGRDTAAQLFFVFNFVYMSGDVNVVPGSTVLWSLSIEEQFYIVFALLVLVSLAFRKTTTVALVAAAASFAVLLPTLNRVIQTAFGAEHERIYYGTDTRIDAIAWGVLAAIAFRSGRPALQRVVRWCQRDKVVLGAVAAYLFSVVWRDDFFRETFRYSLQAVSAAAVILYGFGQPRRSGWLRTVFDATSSAQAVRVVGLASYSIYVAHLSLIFALEPVTSRMPTALAILLNVVASVAGGIVVWRQVEKPVLDFRIRVVDPRLKEL